MDNLIEHQEVEFRDGKRLIPGYLAVIMAGIETHRFTYDQAIDVANTKMAADWTNAQHDRVVAAHFRERR